MHVHGFPNGYVLSIAQSGFTVKFPYLLDVQARHVAWVIARALSDDVAALEASADAEAAWVDAVRQRRGDKSGSRLMSNGSICSTTSAMTAQPARMANMVIHLPRMTSR
jgi:hypothetical protein